MTVNEATFIQDSILLLRSVIASGVTDPITSTRSGNSSFVVTGYPSRYVNYPHITVKQNNFSTRRLGLASEQSLVNMKVEVRVWGRNEKEKDKLAQELYTTLRTKQFDSGEGTVEQNLWGFNINSAVNVDEDGANGIKSKVFDINYQVIT